MSRTWYIRMIAALMILGGHVMRQDASAATSPDAGPLLRDGLVVIDREPVPTRRVAPKYPAAARHAGVSGTVTVAALVGRDGLVHRTRIQKSIGMLDSAAVFAVRQWRFEPATSGGRAIDYEVVIPVRFIPDDRGFDRAPRAARSPHPARPRHDAPPDSALDRGTFIYHEWDPVVVESVQPVYPPAALAAGAEGKVLLRVFVDHAGRVRDVQVQQSAPMFDSAAVQSVRRWRLAASGVSATATGFWCEVPIRFALDRGPRAADAVPAQAPPLTIPGTPAPPSAAEPDTDVVALAREQLGFGQHDRAIAMLAPRATGGPGAFHLWDPRVNLALGDAYRHAGRLDDAIDAYVHAAAAYGDTTVPSALRATWRDRHRTLDGLAQRLADARALAARRVELELPRVDRPVPAFELREVARRRVWNERNTEGRLVALVFIADTSDTALARVARVMTLGQEERFWRVRFLAVLVPPDSAPAPGARERLRTRAAALGLRFPLALDPGGAAARAFGVTTPEATVAIDRRAVIRFRNGWDTPDRRCLQAQLTELVAEASAPASLR